MLWHISVSVYLDEDSYYASLFRIARTNVRNTEGPMSSRNQPPTLPLKSVTASRYFLQDPSVESALKLLQLAF